MRTTSPDFTVTRETVTFTRQGAVMALNIGGWSAEEEPEPEPEPEPEDEEVSRFISLSRIQTNKCHVFRETSKEMSPYR